jgi:hypothetical protein
MIAWRFIRRALILVAARAALISTSMAGTHQAVAAAAGSLTTSPKLVTAQPTGTLLDLLSRTW